ncbi:YwmB family TATA-box binding protein [Marinisporobacter balticus]|uniref:TATA-box binding protein n=1 Tax=Marinisporobacter balticus TaxID=2018667 RepID=A0A4R2LHK1_9FIRM|nr:YwmB family TATA-box binding protein [Marinisporobacter balticus]TCO78805.1 TATA-box binding protein [Marinisporobacter balticus]
MKVKRIFIYGFILMNLFLMFLNHTTAIAKEEGIMEGFNASKAVAEEVNINAYVNMAHVFKNASEGREICLSLAKELGIQRKEIEDTSEKGNIQVILHGEKEQGTICVIVQSSEYEAVKETNIVIDMVYEGLVDVNTVGENIKAILKKYGKATVTSCITGSFNGKLNNAQKEKIVKNMMEYLEATEIEGLREKNMISIVGFSSKIKDYISYGGNQVNINIAMRYNAYEGKTYLWMATPLIAIGY